MPEPASHGLQPYASKLRSSSAGEEFANGIRYYSDPILRKPANLRLMAATPVKMFIAVLARAAGAMFMPLWTWKPKVPMSSSYQTGAS